jgi:hypothetical protein
MVKIILCYVDREKKNSVHKTQPLLVVLKMAGCATDIFVVGRL